MYSKIVVFLESSVYVPGLIRFYCFVLKKFCAQVKRSCKVFTIMPTRRHCPFASNHKRGLRKTLDMGVFSASLQL